MSGIVNKIKEAVHSDNKAHHGQPEGTAGPHNSRVANAADPRVDSDRDGSHNIGANRTAGHGEFGSSNTNTFGTTGHSGLGSSNTHTGTHTGTHNTNTFGSSGTGEGVHGPHGSRVANALDPRVDSDRDGSNTVGGNNRTAGHNEFGSSNTNTFGSTGHSTLGSSGRHEPIGATGNHNTFGSATGHNTHNTSTLGSSGTAEGAHGPHSSRVANALDPRVDSDRDGSRTAGNTGTYNTQHTGISSTGHTGIGGTHNNQHSGLAGSGATGMTGTHGAPTGTYGTHNSRVANAADPRIDSDRDGRAAFNGSGPGPAPHTAGPHSNDMMNKLDPRVDSDLDGSKTIGGNKTYQSGNVSTHHKDPTDAAQVPPSVLKRTIGEPLIEHDDHHHQRERRNSTATHQESFSGI
ncbi:hypothetical protein B0H63DRAFT_252398 [Podospora didyma]|uniref:Cell surface protein n=1 Tax=Podospora didyma TaxID=330526 RepID=A0AAE0KKV5_9PEZI|nr:hypothetical protein B0H63DRAFT_252398 [Podospora didyma]